MQKSFEEKYHRLEETHWWFVARREAICELTRRLDRGARVLEVGCSGGVLIDALRRRGFAEVFGVDISGEAARRCRERGIDGVLVADGERLPFAAEAFDLVVASDVLEHLEDEHPALVDWHRVLKPDGTLIVFVPAFRFLWSAHDVANQHYRRYTASGLARALEGAGYRVDRRSYWNFALFFPALVVRLGQRALRRAGRPQGDQLIPLAPAWNRLLIWLLRAENRALRRVPLPVGVSVFAVARKVAYGAAGDHP